MTTQIIDKNRGSIQKSTVSSMPSNRHFRNAWTLSGTVISEDMAAARVIFKEKIRNVREPLLKEKDVLFMKALEDGATDTQNTIKAQKIKLRDAPAGSAIGSASNID